MGEKQGVTHKLQHTFSQQLKGELLKPFLKLAPSGNNFFGLFMHFPHQLGPNHGKITGAKSPYFLLGHPKEKGLGFHGEGNFVLTTEPITKQSFSPNVFKFTTSYFSPLG